MACEKCDHKGYKESWYHRNNKATPMVSQCHDCKDIRNYSRRVQELWGKGVELDERQPEPKKAEKPKRTVTRTYDQVELFVGGKKLEGVSGVTIEYGEDSPKCPVIPIKR